MSTESYKQIDEAAGDWLARRDSGEWTEEDQVRFEQWLNDSALHRVAFLRIEHVWERSHRLRALGTGSTDAEPPPPGSWNPSPFLDKPEALAASKIPSEPGSNPRVNASAAPDASSQVRRLPPQRLRFAVAASALLAAAVSGTWYLWPSGTSYRTAVGGLAYVPLSDGSRVTLNTDSRIRISVGETERRVELEQGEAYFEVAKDPTRPFVVRAGDKRIIAVGTKFSVRRDAQDVEVVVTEGKVRLEGSPSLHPQAALDGRASSPEALIPGTIAHASDAGVLLEQKPLTEAEESLSWREGVLVFHETTLADAISEFNRYNVRKIVVEDPSVAGLRVAGSFRATNVDAFARLLERGYPLQIEQRGDQIVLKAR